MLRLARRHRELKHTRVRQCGAPRRQRYRTICLGTPYKMRIHHSKSAKSMPKRAASKEFFNIRDFTHCFRPCRWVACDCQAKVGEVHVIVDLQQETLHAVRTARIQSTQQMPTHNVGRLILELECQEANGVALEQRSGEFLEPCPLQERVITSVTRSA